VNGISSQHIEKQWITGYSWKSCPPHAIEGDVAGAMHAQIRLHKGGWKAL
jgi:hypothetical protein